MKIRKIEYPTKLSKINQYDDNIDVFVETEDGKVLTLTVCTPQFYVSLMDKEELNYVPAGPPDIIVRELSEKNIREALQAYCQDNGYWMKAFYLLGESVGIFSHEEMDRMIDTIQFDVFWG